MRNQVQLITYVDRLSGDGLTALHRLLTGPLKGLFGGVHILPRNEHPAFTGAFTVQVTTTVC